MKLKKLFALALAVCMMALAVPAAFAAGLTLDYGTTPTNPVVEEHTPVVYNTRTTSRAVDLADTEGLETSKEVTDNGDGTFTVEIDAYATGTVTTSIDPKPTDFVLVLDKSSSMSRPFSSAVGSTNLQTDKPSGYYVAVGVNTETRHSVRYVEGTGWQILNADDQWQAFPMTVSEWVWDWGWKENSDTITEENIYKTRMASLYDAACDFVDTIHTRAITDNIDHSVAIVSYANANATTTNLGLTTLKTEASVNTVKSTLFSLFATMENGTRIDRGLDKANDIFNTKNEKRTQVVITLTDGVPTDDDSLGALNTEYADDAIDQANELKNKSVLIYTIGIFEDANPNQLYGEKADYAGNLYDTQCTGEQGSYWGISDFKAFFSGIGNDFVPYDTPAANRLLNYVSSNYNYSTVTDLGVTRGSFTDTEVLGRDYHISDLSGYRIDKKHPTRNYTSYYHTADDETSLDTVFTTISNTTASSDADVDETAVLQSYVNTNYFTIDSYSASVYDYDGSSFDTTASGSLTPTEESGVISVSGFDYGGYFVSDRKHDNTFGKKLELTYTVSVKPEFLGGCGVELATDASGIYVKGTNAEAFGQSTVDIPVKSITPTVNPQTIYLSGSVADATKLYTANTYTWEDEYVTITYKVTEGATEKTGALSPTDCTDYTVTCTVDGDGSGTDIAYNKTATATATVHVLKPTVTGTDATIKLGIEAPMAFTYEWNNTCSCEGTIPTVSGDQPEVVPAYSKTNNNNYPSDCTEYTVYAVVGGTQYNDICDTFTVHVKTPVIEGADTTIYRGNSVNVAASVVGWNDCACSGEKPTTVTGGEPGPQFSFSGGKRVSPTDCTEYTATLTKIGGVELKDTKYKDTITNKFQVHVLQPVIDAEDATIYYGSEIDLDSVMKAHSWNTCTHNKTEDDVDESVTEPTPQYRFSIGLNESKDAYSPSNCSDLTATWTLAGKDFTDTFTVHVANPQFSTSDITIYRGNSADLEKQVNVDAEWKCKGHLLHTTKTLPSSGAPAITYAFTVNGSSVGSNYSPAECKEVTATPTVGNKTWSDLNAFKIHVLQPTFTVETQDVWADYNNEVNLTAFGIKSCDLIWQDATAGHGTPSPLPEGAPGVSSSTFTFDKGTQGLYTVGASDETVTVSKLAFVLDNGYGADYELEEKSFTIHVNKFDLTINKTWKDGENVADGTYKQDAIFTVSGGRGTFQVVLPAGQDSIVIKGLLCGQAYTVTEDSNWTWRWKANVDADGKEHVTVNGKTCSAHRDNDNKPVVATSEPEHQKIEADFTNSLINRLWFSFCTFVKNIFGAGRFEGRGN